MTDPGLGGPTIPAAQNADRKPRRKHYKWIIPAALAALIAIPVIASSVNDGDYTPGAFDAHAACESHVKSQLREPSSARFSDQTATGDASNGYLVEGTVDARNGFGGMSRSFYGCRVTFTADQSLTTLLYLD